MNDNGGMPQESPQLLIRINPNGTVTVHGPLGNRVLCYGMLEAARDAVRDYVTPTQATPRDLLGPWQRRPDAT